MREYRVIVFDDPEIVMALSGLRRKQGRPIPPGHVVKLEILQTPELGAALHIETDDGRKVVEKFDTREVAAGFVATLIERNVPMQATAPKTVSLIEGRWLALLVHPAEKKGSRRN